MDKARIAVIGAGLIGRKHIDVLRSSRPDSMLAAVCDPAPAAAAEAQKLGYTIYKTIPEMLDLAKPEGVVIAVPNQLHLSAALACVARGIPVLVEKPVADSLQAARELVEAGARAGVPILVGHHRRHNPIMRQAVEIVRAGGIGRVVAVTAMWMNHKPGSYYDVAWRREEGGGPVLINAIHDIDCLRMLCGDVATVQAATDGSVRGYPVEETAAAVLTFKSGALATLIVSDTASAPWSWESTSRENGAFPNEPENCFLLAGTKGSLTVPNLQHRWHEPGKESWLTPLTQLRIPTTPADPYHEQMRNFAAVIRGAEAPVVSGRDGAITLATTLAITEAARRGAPVQVDQFMAA